MAERRSIPCHRLTPAARAGALTMACTSVLSVLALTAPMRERSGKVAQEGPLLSLIDLTAR